MNSETLIYNKGVHESIAEMGRLAYIVTALTASCATVKFTKKNGDARILRCTLNYDYIKKHKSVLLPEASGDTIIGKHYNPVSHSLLVFDMDKKDWRTINLSTIETFDWPCEEIGIEENT